VNGKEVKNKFRTGRIEIDDARKYSSVKNILQTPNLVFCGAGVLPAVLRVVNRAQTAEETPAPPDCPGKHF